VIILLNMEDLDNHILDLYTFQMMVNILFGV